jgi:hypothetical protein
MEAHASPSDFGGLALSRNAIWSATSSTWFTCSAIAIRFSEPYALISTGKVEIFPEGSNGFSISNALPPSGDFISRLARAVISNSVCTGSVMRINSPADSSFSANSRMEEKAMFNCSGGPRLSHEECRPQDRHE